MVLSNQFIGMITIQLLQNAAVFAKLSKLAKAQQFTTISQEIVAINCNLSALCQYTLRPMTDFDADFDPESMCILHRNSCQSHPKTGSIIVRGNPP